MERELTASQDLGRGRICGLASPCHPPSRETPMKKLLVLVGTTIGSMIGWWMGSGIGMMTSFMLSMVGFGVGMWVGARIARSVDV